MNKMSTPKVWSRFTAKKRDGTVLKLRIQDLPSDRFDDALNFNMTYFISEENFQRCTGVHKNPDAMAETREIVIEMMRKPNYHISICCLDDDPNTVGDIIGVAAIILTKNTDPSIVDEIKTIEPLIQTEEVRKLMKLLVGVNTLHKVDYEKYYDGRGVTVHPDYRGLGIATEFLKARRMVCKEHGVPMTEAWMTSLGTQKAAERDGWKTSFEISFDELARRFDVTFDRAPPLCKAMYSEIDLSS